MSDQQDSAIRSVFKGGSVVFVGLAIELGLSFVAKVLMAQILGKVDYGAATIGITLLSFGSTVGLVGLNTGVGRYLPRFEDAGQRKGILVSALQLVLAVNVAIGLVVIAFADPIATHLFRAPETTTIVRIVGIGIPFLAMLKLSVGVIQGLQKTLPKVLLRNVGQPIIRFALIGVALVLGAGAAGIAWAYTITAIVAGVLGGVYVLRRTSVLADVDPVSMRRELLTFSAPLLITTAMIMVFSNIDIFLISFFGDTGDVGVYNVVYPLAELLTVLLSAFGFIFMPIISELHAEEQFDSMERTYRIVTKWILIGTLPLFLVMAFFPAMTIRLTFGGEYAEGAATLVVLAVGFFAHAIAGPNVNTLTSIGRTKLIMYDNVTAAAVNVVLNVVLIPEFSYFGAAVATAVSYLLLNGLYAEQLYRQTGVHPLTSALLRPAAIALAAIGVIYAVATLVVPLTVGTLVAMLGAFLLLYAVAIVRFGIEREEVMLLLSFEERFGVDLGPLKAVAARLME
jgi:O-antigen/teichoic acid export membrane protein